MEPQNPNLSPKSPPMNTEQMGRLLDFADICTQSLEIDMVLSRASAMIIEWGLADVVGIAFPPGMLGPEPVLHISSGSPLVPTTEGVIQEGMLSDLVEAGMCEGRPERYRLVPGANLTPMRDAVRQEQAYRLHYALLGEDGSAYGVISLYGFQDWILSGRSKALLSRAVNFLTRAVRHAFCLIDLERSTTEDPLTGALNRRGYDKVISREFERARRARRNVGLVVIDVDYFKQINDTHGHPVGDEVLVGIVQCVRETLRCSDVLCRLGGDEFAIILPEVDSEIAAQVARRVAVACRALEIGDFPVTLSIGVASIQPDWSATPEQLLEAADQALYESKRNGRAQVSLASFG